MSDGMVIIGAGFAARQLIKNIRKLDTDVVITLIADDSGDEYNKPALSHVISQGQRAADLTRQTAGAFAEQFNLRLYPRTRITAIDAKRKILASDQRTWHYETLVLATGARALTPPVPGNDGMITLNSQGEFHRYEAQLRDAHRILVLGGGLIGCELAMDFCRAGKQVTLVDRAPALLSALMPAPLSAPLHHGLGAAGVSLLTGQQLVSVENTPAGQQVTLASGVRFTVDAVVSAIGLRPETALARQAGLAVNRGILVNRQLQTANPAIYALGDCAEIEGQVLPFLQPIQLSAMALAQHLAGRDVALTLPPMLVTIKTPLLPLQMAGQALRADLTWQVTTTARGMTALGYDDKQRLCAFVVSEEQTQQAFSLLRELHSAQVS